MTASQNPSRRHVSLLLPILTPAFSPQSRLQLKSAVDACLKLSPKGECANSPHGSIEGWDVSRVTDMSRVFAHAKSFDRDLSKWDVSGVKDMSGMFLGATSFNGDLGKWDVSSVKDMYGMFWGASGFNRKLCGDAWVHSQAKKTIMFQDTSVVSCMHIHLIFISLFDSIIPHWSTSINYYI